MKLPLIQIEGRYLFHPYLVHFPVALFILEAFLILLWVTRKEERYEQFSFLILKIAVFLLPFVMLAGYKDAGGLIPRARTHFILALGLLVCNGSRLLIRWKTDLVVWQNPWRMAYLLLVFTGVVLTILTAHFGGKLVYF